MNYNKAKIRYNKDFAVPGKKDSRVSAYTEDFKGEYYNLSIKNLKPFKNQARRVFDEESIKELAETIRVHGIRQPLTVLAQEEENGFFEVVSGERRLRAAKLLGKEKVPCIIIRDRLQAEEISIIENVQRQDLHPIELMKAYKNLLDHGICTSVQQVANKVGVAKSSVIDVLNLSVLPDHIQQFLVEKNVRNRDMLRKLSKADHNSHEQIISDFLKLRDGKKSQVPRTGKIQKKIDILNIVIAKDEFYIVKNKVDMLKNEQKIRLQEMLSKIVDIE